MKQFKIVKEQSIFEGTINSEKKSIRSNLSVRPNWIGPFFHNQK